MINIPDTCPCCGSSRFFKVDSQTANSGFSAGKAAIGGILFGPIGLLGGALGKKHSYMTMVCRDCQFTHTYQLY